MSSFDVDNAHTLPNEIVKALARVSRTHDAAYLSVHGCVEAGDGKLDLINVAGDDRLWRTQWNEEQPPAGPATKQDVMAVAAHAKVHGLRLVFKTMAEAESVAAMLGDGARLSSLALAVDKAEVQSR